MGTCTAGRVTLGTAGRVTLGTAGRVTLGKLLELMGTMGDTPAAPRHPVKIQGPVHGGGGHCARNLAKVQEYTRSKAL